jgi:hypothetical protein
MEVSGQLHAPAVLFAVSTKGVAACAHSQFEHYGRQTNILHHPVVELRTVQP